MVKIVGEKRPQNFKGKAPRKGPAAPSLGAGTCVVVYLREPREKSWGFLLRMEPSGVWIRGIELASFEDWARGQAAGADGTLGLNTFFVPFLRVEKLVVDERMGPVPSMAERFEAITGKRVESALAD
jgi:hypothetical protein